MERGNDYRRSPRALDREVHMIEPNDAQGRLDAARLGAALIEQARLGDAFARAVGTSSEQPAFERLQRSGRNVSACDRRVKRRREDSS
jgi:hypothetical protein